MERRRDHGGDDSQNDRLEPGRQGAEQPRRPAREDEEARGAAGWEAAEGVLEGPGEDRDRNPGGRVEGALRLRRTARFPLEEGPGQHERRQNGGLRPAERRQHVLQRGQKDEADGDEDDLDDSSLHGG